MRESKPVTQLQEDIHAVLTGSLLASPVAGAWLAWHVYTAGYVLGLYALILGLVVPVVVLLFWLDTEVQWRKREATARKVLARITNNV